ncbi:hypothetical protein I7I50_01889 [Histoplasma capsulatum G186AR]|uniref:Uncharacterized protein n=1 Tax=Ajellomyces capsulatus TaxID=5037 RepID=A0A8H7YC82_AJECA|nr:hypothetical protein I7I52_12103 [Histoplasma capsulatum]QSS71151.1 hypothetical protein I7I50_01889 [Histoplasma capsulatum G186AR]
MYFQADIKLFTSWVMGHIPPSGSHMISNGQPVSLSKSALQMHLFTRLKFHMPWQALNLIILAGL